MSSFKFKGNFYEKETVFFFFLIPFHILLFKKHKGRLENLRDVCSSLDSIVSGNEDVN
jgi:hypothetical protein